MFFTKPSWGSAIKVKILVLFPDVALFGSRKIEKVEDFIGFPYYEKEVVKRAPKYGKARKSSKQLKLQKIY